MRWIATASRDMTLRLWDNKADALCCSFKLQEEITSIAINSDGSPPAVRMGRFGSWDRDAPVQPAVAISTGNDGVVSFVAISATGRWIFSIDSGGTIQMWDRDAGGQLVSTSGVGGPIRSVACAEDGIVEVAPEIRTSG